uniref:Uncharacterized protein n=1 Tax=Heterorhabditis bacteriophora TaxID=37862 RepID=A0A1I7X1W0_HETBA
MSSQPIMDFSPVSISYVWYCMFEITEDRSLMKQSFGLHREL